MEERVGSGDGVLERLAGAGISCVSWRDLGLELNQDTQWTSELDQVAGVLERAGPGHSVDERVGSGDGILERLTGPEVS